MHFNRILTQNIVNRSISSSPLSLFLPKLVSLVAGIHQHQHHRRRSHAGAAVTPVRRLSGGGGGEAPGKRHQQQEQGRKTRGQIDSNFTTRIADAAFTVHCVASGQSRYFVYHF